MWKSSEPLRTRRHRTTDWIHPVGYPSNPVKCAWFMALAESNKTRLRYPVPTSTDFFLRVETSQAPPPSFVKIVCSVYTEIQVLWNYLENASRSPWISRWTHRTKNCKNCQLPFPGTHLRGKTSRAAPGKQATWFFPRFSIRNACWSPNLFNFYWKQTFPISLDFCFFFQLTSHPFF